jgi:hypothetical protein
MTEDEPFFHLPTVNLAIERLARAETITIFAGAGVAKDRRSPDWHQLVDDLLQLALDDHRSDELRSHSEFLANLFGERTPPLLLASTVRYLDQRTFDPAGYVRAIARSLYQDEGPTGNLAQGIAWLATILKVLKRDVVVITTNYDTYIEGARGTSPVLGSGDPYADEIGKTVLKSYVDINQEISDLEIPVYHFHGVINKDGSTLGDTTFCEVDYSGIRGKWQEELLIDRLVRGSVLFVGTSMTDPYIAHCLSEAARRSQPTDPDPTESTDQPGRSVTGRRRLVDSPWIAVLPLQGEAWWSDLIRAQKADETVLASTPSRSAVLKVAEARLAYLGVQALYADFYSQVAQFCWETKNCVLQGPESYSEANSEHRYGHRLQSWWRYWDQSLRVTKDIAESQGDMQNALFDVKGEIAHRLTATASDKSEQFKVELWVRMQTAPTDRELVLWASSQAVLRDESALHSATIQHQSQYIAVQTFAEGRCIGPPFGEEARRLERERRWRSYISVPIWLDQDPWFHLPVGTIAVMGAHPEGPSKSALASLDPEDRDWIVEKLQEAGLALLSP